MFDTKMNTKMKAIKTGDGRVTGYIEVFRTAGGKWVTIPGASRFVSEKKEKEHVIWGN